MGLAENGLDTASEEEGLESGQGEDEDSMDFDMGDEEGEGAEHEAGER